MEKLTEFQNGFKITKRSKKLLQEIARKEYRKDYEVIRIAIDKYCQDYISDQTKNTFNI